MRNLLQLRSLSGIKKWKVSQLLLENGAEIPTDLDLWPILQDAVKDLNSTMVSILAKYKPNIISNDGIISVLVRAIALALAGKSSESTEQLESFGSVLEYLISLGADVRHEALESGDSAIIIASKETNNSSVIRELLSAGADPYHENLNGLDSFRMAALHQNNKSLRCLVLSAVEAPRCNHWASGFTSIGLEGSDDIASLCRCLKSASLIDRKNQQSQTLLHLAAEVGNSTFIARLLEHGAGVNILDDRGWLPVHYAGFSGHMDAVKLLLPIPEAPVTGISTSTRPDILTKINEKENTMLHVAIKNNNPSLVSHLQYLGADIVAPIVRPYDISPEPPLYFASREGFDKVVSQLLSFGADVEACPTSGIDSDDGWRSLHIAAFSGHIGIVQSLIHAKADVCAATKRWKGTFKKPTGIYDGDKGTWQALHLATMMGYTEIVSMLLENGADIHASSGTVNTFYRGHGPTALHIALDKNIFYCRNGSVLDHSRLQIARMLVERGAKVDGVADHLELHDILKFKGFDELWDTLRAGISEDSDVL